MTIVPSIFGHVSERQLATRLGMSVWGLRAWRKRGYGPAHVKIGRSTFYSEVAITSFFEGLSE